MSHFAVITVLLLAQLDRGQAVEDQLQGANAHTSSREAV